MKKYLTSFFGLVLALCLTQPVLAQYDDDGGSSGAAPPSPVEGRPFYFSPMFSYLLADDDRGTGDGYGLTLALGKKLTYGLNLEVSGFFIQADSSNRPGTAGSGTLNLSGLALTAMIFPLTQYPNFYGVLSVGKGRGDNQPGLFSNYSSTVFDSGVGYLYPLTQRIILRLEARYHMDASNKDRIGVQTPPKDNTAFYEGLFNAGVLIPLGKLPSHELPPVEEAPVEVASTEAVDSDGDGVADDADTCPDTPAGAIVDANGCEADTDGDGVPDRIDLCADTAAGTEVGPTGCANDADGDGVLDDIDECPQTPAGSKVLANGCGLQSDCRTPRPGQQVDENGCASGQAFILKGVAFEYDSTRLTEEAKTILDQVAETLKSYPDVSVEIAGHTDSSGTDSYNLGLSERRSIAVKDYLTAHGVNAERMTPVGYGESQPIDNNNTDAGRINNRRVELRVIEEGQANTAAAPVETEPVMTDGAAPADEAGADAPVDEAPADDGQAAEPAEPSF